MGNVQDESMLVHTSSISFLLCTGLAVNIIFLMSLKADKKSLNNNEKIQTFKTCLLIVAMVVYIPFELWVTQTDGIDPEICTLKDTLQTLFLDSYPIVTTTLAIIRFRLAIFPDKTEILVRKSYCIVIIICTSLLPIFVAISRIALSSMIQQDEQKNFTVPVGSYCYQVNPVEINYFNICNSILMFGIPSVFVLILYYRIMYISSISFHRVQQFGINSNRCRRTNIFCSKANIQSDHDTNTVAPHVPQHGTRGSRILKSVSTLVAFFLFVTVPIGTLEIYLNVLKFNWPVSHLNLILLYLKTAMCLFHALGEGIFYLEKRQKTKLCFDTLISRSRPTTLTGRRISNNSNTVVPTTNLTAIPPIQMPKTRRHLSPVEELTTSRLCLENVYGQNLSFEKNDKISNRVIRENSKMEVNVIITDNSRLSNACSLTDISFNNRRLSNACSPADLSVNTPKSPINDVFDYDTANNFKIDMNTDSNTHIKDKTLDQVESRKGSKYRNSESKTCSISTYHSFSVHSNLSELTLPICEDFQCGTPLSESLYSPTEIGCNCTHTTDRMNVSRNCWMTATSIMSPVSPVSNVFEQGYEILPAKSPQMLGLRKSIRTLSVISDTL